MDYICPECAYTDDARGRCPSCNVPLIHIDDVGESESDSEADNNDSF